MQSALAACVCKLPGTSAFTYMHNVLTLCLFVTHINVDTKLHTWKLKFMQLLEMLFELKSYLYTLLFMLPISLPSEQ